MDSNAASPRWIAPSQIDLPCHAPVETPVRVCVDQVILSYTTARAGGRRACGGWQHYLRQNNPTGKISLSPSGKSPLGLPPSCPRGRGVGHRHRTLGWDVVDAAASGAQVNCRAGFGLSQTRERSNGAQTNGAEAYGEVVWFRHPLLVSSWRRHAGPTGRGDAANSSTTVTRRIRRRGERVISRKAIAQGMSDVLR